MFDFEKYLKKVYEMKYSGNQNLEMDRVLSIASECLQKRGYTITTEEVNRVFDASQKVLERKEPLIVSYQKDGETLYDGALDIGKRRVLFYDDGEMIDFLCGEARIPALYGYVYLRSYASHTVDYYSPESIEYITAAMGTSFADITYSAQDLDQILSFVTPDGQIKVDKLAPDKKLEAAIAYANAIANKQEAEKAPEMGLK